jgi:hypothetical protein
MNGPTLIQEFSLFILRNTYTLGLAKFIFEIASVMNIFLN